MCAGVGGAVFAFDGVDGDAVILTREAAIVILGGQRVAARRHDLGAAGDERAEEVGGFGGDVQAGGHADSP